jgi:acyl carrier protein
MSDVRERVVEVIVDLLGVDPGMVTPRSNYFKDLGADSLDTTELIMRFEDEYSIEISDLEADDIHTVQDTIDYIEEKLNG